MKKITNLEKIILEKTHKKIAKTLKEILDGEDKEGFINEDLYMEYLREKKEK